MKKIITTAFAIFAIFFTIFAQSPISSIESFSINPSVATFGIFTRNPTTGNVWSRTGSNPNYQASVSRFVVGTTTLTLTNNLTTIGYTAIKIKFKEWITGSFPISQVVLEYSLDGGSNWNNTGFISGATTLVPGLENVEILLPNSAEEISTLKVRFTFSGSDLTTGTQTYKIDDFGIYGTPPPMIYYNVANASNLQELASWGTEEDGSGDNPSDFVTDNQTFNIFNGTSASITDNWSIDGTGSKIVIGNGTDPVTFTIPSGSSVFSETIDISLNGTLNNESDANTPTFGTLSAGSTVIYSSDLECIVQPSNYYNLILSGNGDKLLNGGGEIEVSSLDLSSLNADIVLGADLLTITGTITGTASFSSTSESQITINKTGGGSVGTLFFDPSSNSINKLTIDGGIVNLGSDILLDGTVPTLSIATGATLNTGTYIIDGTVSTELIDLRGTVQTSNLSGFSSGASTTFTSNVSAPTMGANSTVHYNANSGTQVVTPFPEVNAYANLTMSGNATKDFNGDDFYINKDFIVSGGNCTLSNTSLFKFTGADQNIAGISYYEVEVSGSGIKTLPSTDSTKINTSLTIGANTQVVTNGKLVLQSLVGTNAAVIIDNTSGANGISGNVMVKRYLGNKEDANPANPPAWFLSSPVSGIALSAFKVANNNIYQYINSKTAGTRWTVISQYGSVATGKGYLVRSYANKNNYYYGTVNSGDISVPLTAAGDNWNLIGNPYPSRIEWDADKIDMTHVGGSKECKVYTGTGNPPYTFKTEGNTLIAVGQAVFVQAVTNGNLVFSNASRTTQATGGTLLRQESDYTNRMELYLRKNNRSSDMAVIWAQNSPARSNKYDLWYDMNKIMPGSTAPALYMTKENNNIDLFAFGVNEGSVNVPLTTYLPVDTTYTFEFNDIQKIDPAYSVYLVDNDQNTVQDLRESSTYKFTSTTGTKNRFSVQFSTVVTNVSTDDFLENQFSVYSENGLAQISAGGVPTKVLVRDISGKIVYDLASPNNKQITADLSDHPAGIYIATIETPTKVLNKKFVLNK